MKFVCKLPLIGCLVALSACMPFMSESSEVAPELSDFQVDLEGPVDAGMVFQMVDHRSASAESDGITVKADALDRSGVSNQAYSGVKRLGVIFFEPGVSRLSIEDEYLLDQVFQIYRQWGGTVIISGHAETLFDVSAERNLSEVRSKTVASYLLKLGVSETSLDLRAVGSGQSFEEGVEWDSRVELFHAM